MFNHCKGLWGGMYDGECNLINAASIFNGGNVGMSRIIPLTFPINPLLFFIQ